jgi:hypothetical protein
VNSTRSTSQEVVGGDRAGNRDLMLDDAGAALVGIDITILFYAVLTNCAQRGHNANTHS